jgi:uncharacterized membrane protein
MMAAAAFILLRRAARQPGVSSQPGPMPFALGLIGLGALLALVPEFLYLKDTFGSRMNTVFKLYYASWILWGLAAAYLLGTTWPGRRGQGWAVLSVVPLFVGFVYTGTALWDKTSGFTPSQGFQLDGTLHLSLDSPSDYEAIQWINGALPTGVIAEAVGGSYTGFGRIAAHTGLPTVLGWEFHEVQWRGDAAPQGSRAADIELLYRAREWEEASPILDQYDIDYVYIGPLENSTYGPVQTRKFDLHWQKVYASDEVVIYARPGVMGP